MYCRKMEAIMKIIYGYDSRVMLQQCMVKIENNPNKMKSLYGFIANNDDVPKSGTI